MGKRERAAPGNVYTLWALVFFIIFTVSCQKQSPAKARISLERVSEKIQALYENEKRPVSEDFKNVRDYEAAVERYNKNFEANVAADAELSAFFWDKVIPKLQEQERYKYKIRNLKDINYYSYELANIILNLLSER